MGRMAEIGRGKGRVRASERGAEFRDKHRLQRLSSVGKLVTVGLVASLMAACETFQMPSGDDSEKDAADAQPADPKERLAQVITEWLNRADQALMDDRLLTPENDNAHDRYRAVLYLDPGNSRAESGLDAIVLRYLDLARSATRHSAFSQARAYMQRADTVDPGNPLVADMQKQIDQTQSEYEERLSDSGFMLDAQRLSARDEALVEELQALAQQVRDSGEYVLIISRTDDEGRWIYQKMREGVPNYLLRGDINIGSPPRIELLPPL